MKNTAKLLLALLLVLCTVVAFAACGDEDNVEWQETMPPTNNNQNQGSNNGDNSQSGLTNEGVAPGEGWGAIITD